VSYIKFVCSGKGGGWSKMNKGKKYHTVGTVPKSNLIKEGMAMQFD
jgi:hypothetical protein